MLGTSQETIIMRKAKWLLPIGGISTLGALGLLWFTGILSHQHESPALQSSTRTPVPLEFAIGEALFHTHCAGCHGPAGVGTAQGPSFLSRVYVPNHHSDASFYLAVKQGVRAHHWNFGNMPALPHVTDAEVTQITAYVRRLQQQAGVR
jgi:mono/diheme cytochrome c family protein